MRSRRSAILLRCAARCTLRSSLESFGPPNSLRRRLASEVVCGAGGTGPRLAASRLGVGRPLGAVVFAERAGADSSATSYSSAGSGSLAFRRPKRLTQPGYCGGAPARHAPDRFTPYRGRMRVLVAPDCFGDTLTA